MLGREGRWVGEREQENEPESCSYEMILSGGTPLKVCYVVVAGTAMVAWLHKSVKLVICSLSVAIYSIFLSSPCNNWLSTQVHLPCFQCSSKDKKRIKWTILDHFKDNLAHLNNLRASGEHLDALAFVEHCHNEMVELLHGIDEAFDPGSFNLAGECISAHAL